MHIREYLSREAQRISERSLSGIANAEAWRTSLPQRRAKFLQMMGVDELLDKASQTPLNVTVTGVVERDGYRIEKLYYQSLPNLYVSANLYVPQPLEQPTAGVLYVCGHSESQKFHYQAHPRRFAQLGFVCLIVDSIWGGEVRGYHHGCYSEGWFNWYSRGYTPAGIELLNGSRGLDVLCARDEVDSTRLGVTGISGGGAATWWIAAGDERIACAATVCGTAGLGSQIRDRTIDGHCDCMWFINTGLWDYPDVGALIAPRPLLIANADADTIFEIRSVRALFEKLRKLYDMLGAGNHVQLLEYAGPHSYSPLARKTIFSWFLKHLMGREVAPEEIADVDERPEVQESDETLTVFVSGQLPDDLTPRVHEEVLRPVAPPSAESQSDVPRLRRELAEALRADTFAHFPDLAPPLSIEVTQQLA
ncbi:MAG: hypothetical protein H5T86_15425, partial [Armatimonadetes bacterium]|nr:hypothetical protein [Armatimonadota bacterium]